MIVDEFASGVGDPNHEAVTANRREEVVDVSTVSGPQMASKLPVIELYPDGMSVRATDFPETRLTPDTDHAALAQACGGAGATVHTPQEMEDAIRWALDQTHEGRCAVLNVVLPQPCPRHGCPAFTCVEMPCRRLVLYRTLDQLGTPAADAKARS